MRMRKVYSTSVKSVGYTARSKTLGIRFDDGSLYHYSGVPRSAYEKLLKAESKGRFVSENIRDRYTFKEIT